MDAIVFDHVSKVYPPVRAPAPIMPVRSGPAAITPVTPEPAPLPAAAAGQTEAAAAVDDVCLAIPEGQIAVILGASGAGKTTLLKMVNRLLEPTAGRIYVAGTEVHDLPADALRRRIGYVIQQIGLFPHWTVAQNVATVPRLLGWERRRIDERVDELLELLGLPPAEYRNRYPRQLSGGQQQRVGLARALAADPEIMLMDEPFGAVDAVTRGRLQDELLAIQGGTRKTVLFVTHDVEEAIRLADMLVIMNLGRVVQVGTPLNVIARPEDAFVARLVGVADAHLGPAVSAAGSAGWAGVTRLLRLLSVRNAMQPLSPEVAKRGLAPLRLDDSLRDALARLLREGEDVLPVADGESRLVGQLDLRSLRESLRATSAPTPPEPAEAPP
jgi:osmoprotectant transport system ATP-binding protein